MQDKTKYIIKYNIPAYGQTNQRPNNSIVKNLTKDEAQNWTCWLKTRKINATYKIITI